MDFCIKTSRGGKTSVHFGKLTTTNLFKDEWRVITDALVINDLRTVHDTEADLRTLKEKYECRINEISYPYVRSTVDFVKSTGPAPAPTTTDKVDASATPAAGVTSDKPAARMTGEIFQRRKSVAKRLQDFFSEFTFDPGCRFLNTMSKLRSVDKIKSYVSSYLDLCTQPDRADIIEKMKSAEFTSIASEITGLASDRVINKRVRLYYGDPGTGKTTRAINENPGAKVFICNSSLTGDDLLQVFDFNDENGHPVFKKSIIREAMEAGVPIILDEINLLSLDALRTLQEITDDKSVVNFHGDEIQIKDGFKIIGTMNLMICGQPFGLPEALVDRAEYIEEFKLSPADLAAYGF